jgi:flagellar hook-length control protein FliK
VARAVQATRHEDGSHSVTVRLDPPELGHVEVEVRVHDGRLSVHAMVESTGVRDTLTRALPELRAALETGGLSTGSLDVGARSSGQGPFPDGTPGRPASFAGPTDASPRADRGQPHHTTGTAPTSRLDLRL